MKGILDESSKYSRLWSDAWEMTEGDLHDDFAVLFVANFLGKSIELL